MLCNTCHHFLCHFEMPLIKYKFSLQTGRMAETDREREREREREKGEM